jgi:hypothetical protein
MVRTREQVRKAIFGKLNGLRRKLHAQGVPCAYSRSRLTHDDAGIGFTVTYRLSDDQTSLVPQISIRTAESTETFDDTNFDQGIARIKGLIQAHEGTNGQHQKRAAVSTDL